MTAVGTISLYSLLLLSQEYVKAGAPDAAHYQTLGMLFLGAHDWAFWVNQISYSLGASIFYYLFYTSRLIPRFISVWGLIAVALLFTGAVLQIFGHTVNFADVEGIILYLPLGLFEIVLGTWLIVKSFNAQAHAGQ